MGFTVSTHYCSYCGKTEYFIFHHQACCYEDEASHHQNCSNVNHQHQEIDEETHICKDLTHCSLFQQEEFNSCQTHHHIFKITSPYSIHKSLIFKLPYLVLSIVLVRNLIFCLEVQKQEVHLKLISWITPLKEAIYLYVHQLVYYA